MELPLLFIGLLIYTAAIVKCTNVERDFAWRRWLHDKKSVLAPDGKNILNDKPAHERRRFESIED